MQPAGGAQTIQREEVDCQRGLNEGYLWFKHRFMTVPPTPLVMLLSHHGVTGNDQTIRKLLVRGQQ